MHKTFPRKIIRGYLMIEECCESGIVFSPTKGRFPSKALKSKCKTVFQFKKVKIAENCIVKSSLVTV
jgi:hypothetical protein